MDYESNLENEKNVCKDQQTYNKALRKALNNYDNKENECTTDICRTKMTIFTIITMVFYLWAILLASKVNDKEHRILHILLALITGPLYVISYYCSNFSYSP